MSGRGYASAVGDVLAGYVAFKEGVGHDTGSLRWLARSLDRWCVEHGSTGLDRETVMGYAEERLSRCDPTRPQTWPSTLRCLARWARLNGFPDAFVLPDDVCSGPHHRRVPYLLTDAEVEAFFAAAAGYEDGTPMSWQAGCLFGLMCCCGLRTCEAMRLTRGDFDADGRTLDVLRSKGRRSRRLALTGEVAEMVSRCDARTTASHGEDRPRLLVTSTGAGLSHNAVYRAFGRIWSSAGLPTEKGGRRPTPYAFRHRFAYANIEAWWREGRDVMSMMPYLQRYMGHSSVQSTMWYVHTSPDFLSSFAAEVSSLDALLPEVGFRGQA